MKNKSWGYWTLVGCLLSFSAASWGESDPVVELLGKVPKNPVAKKATLPTEADSYLREAQILVKACRKNHGKGDACSAIIKLKSECQEQVAMSQTEKTDGPYGPDYRAPNSKVPAKPAPQLRYICPSLMQDCAGRTFAGAKPDYEVCNPFNDRPRFITVPAETSTGNPQ
jgi:hypothetical protein